MLGVASLLIFWVSTVVMLNVVALILNPVKMLPTNCEGLKIHLLSLITNCTFSFKNDLNLRVFRKLTLTH
jgi:hypothetical protein